MKFVLLLLAIVSLIPFIICNEGRKSPYLKIDVPKEDDMSAQWAIEVDPKVNAKELIERLGLQYEGPHSSLPNIHHARIKPEHRTREVHLLKVQVRT
jgi:hypothetical protein